MKPWGTAGLRSTILGTYCIIRNADELKHVSTRIALATRIVVPVKFEKLAETHFLESTR